MCGFAGIIGVSSEAETKKLYDGCVKFLKQRGPDALNLWTSPNREITFAHAQLAIVDQTTEGRQPMVSEALGLTIMMVGEIYNYREIKSRFPDYQFKGASDTEVLFPLYASEGIDGLKRLKGMFTLAIADTRKKQCLLFRDAVGKKPIFIQQAQNKIFFGSSILPLIAAGASYGASSQKLKKHYLEYGHLPPHESFCEQYKPLRPGEYVLFDWDGVRISDGRVVPNRTEVYNNETLRDSQSRFNALFQQAVDRRLENNPEPTLLLSGGLDSTAIALALKEIKPRLLTVRTGLPFTNDEFYARYAARKLGLRLEVIPLPWLNRPTDLYRCLEKQDEPFGVLSFVPLFQLMNKVSESTRVVITGDGGDEAVMGYGQTDAWRGSGSLNHEFLVGPDTPGWMSAWGQRAVGSDLAGHGFVKVDRASAENAVESRSPFMDWDLLSFVRSLPYAHLTAEGKSKSLLHAYLSDFPSWFLERPKLGFKVNTRWMLAATNFKGMRELITDQTIDDFDDLLPVVLRHKASKWKHRDILQNFNFAWRLLAWSQFKQRIQEARS